MADVGGIIGEYLPRLAIKEALNIGAWIIIGGLILLFIFLVTYFLVRNLKYNKKIIIWEMVDQMPRPTRKDRAMEIPLSKGGDTITFLRKHKKYLPNPKYQTGKWTYHIFIRKDDEWMNFKFADFDEEAKKMGAVFLDKEARFARTQIQKGLKERYDKINWLSKYGVLVFSLAFIAVIGIMSWLLFDKWIEGLAAVPTILDKLAELLDRSDKILVRLDNICAGGSGMIPALFFIFRSKLK